MTNHATLGPKILFGRATLLLACLAASSVATAEVIDNLSYTSYEVDASKSRSLSKLLDNASPHRDGDAVYYGFTRWRVGWKVQWHYGPDRRCKLTQVNTELSGSIDLPALTREAAKAVDAALLALPEMVDCDALQAAVTATGNETMARFKGRGAQYDLDTQHGKTQGAWLND